jgi:hypothetical protein
MEDQTFSREQINTLKKIWDERFREPARKRSREEAVLWISFLSISRHWYNRLAEEGEPNPWTSLVNALYSINPDVSQGEFITELEGYFRIPYIREKPPTPKPPEEVIRKAVEPLKKQLEETRKAIEELRKAIEKISAPSAEVGLPASPPLGGLGRGVGATYASLMFPKIVYVLEYKYGFKRKKEDALKQFESMVQYFDRYTGPVVSEYATGTYYEYEFIVPVLDISTVNTLSLLIPFPLDYWYAGGYLYKIWGISDCPLDLWYERFGTDPKIMPSQYQPWFEAVCTRIVPEIRRLKYDAIGKPFHISRRSAK